MIQELASAKQQLQSLQKELLEFKSIQQQFYSLTTQYQILQQDYQAQHQELLHLQQEIRTYESTIQHHASQLLIQEQQLYERQRLIENHQYEEKLSRKTIEQLKIENENFKNLIADYEQQKGMEVLLWKQKFQEVQKQLEQSQRDLDQRVAQEKAILLEQSQSVKQQLLNQLEEKQLKIKQLQFEYHREKQLLQKNMEKTMAQLQNTTNHVIDKTLMGNLIVSYFQRKR